MRTNGFIYLFWTIPTMHRIEIYAEEQQLLIYSAEK